MSDLDLLDTEMDELNLLDDELDLDGEFGSESNNEEKAKLAAALTGEAPSNLELIKDVPVEVTVEVSRKSLPLKDILAFEAGTTIMLDKNEGEPVDIKINGILFGTGCIVTQDGKYGVRILSIVNNSNNNA